MIKIQYSELKTLIDSGTVQYRHVELTGYYIVLIEDGAFQASCEILKDTADATDYETNYKAEGEVANTDHDDEGRVIVHSTPRPNNTTTFFAGAGDDQAVADGPRMLFSMLNSDTEKYIDMTFNETVYIKDGHFVSQDAPFGAYLSATIRHPLAGEVAAFARNIPILGSWPIDLNSDDRGKLDQGLILRITVGNSNGTNPQDPAASFKVAGRLEFYRATT